MKRANLRNMTPEEVTAHKRELQRLKTIRLSASKGQKQKEKHMSETPEEHRARLDHKNKLRIENARKRGVQPKPPKRSKEEKTSRKVAWAKEKRLRNRLEFFARYGGKCACCGTTDYRWLTVHHIHKNGGIERAQQKSNWNNRHAMMLKEPFRDDLELLCYNCHLARDYYGCCPHNDPTSPLFIKRDA